MELMILLASVFVYLIERCETGAIIEIRLLQYDLKDGSLAGGGGSGAGMLCCDAGPSTTGTCPADQCDPYFYICIQDVRHNQGCYFGDIKTGYTNNKDHAQLSDKIGSSKTPNPIIFQINEYGGVIIPTITIYDEDKSEGANHDDKIDYVQHVFSHAPDYNNNRTYVIPITMQGQVSSLQLELNVRCEAHYYGNDCKTYCIPSSETYCDDNGKSICIPGKPCDPNRPLPTPPPVPSTTPTTTVASTKLPVTSTSVMSSSTSAANIISTSTVVSTATVQTTPSTGQTMPSASRGQTRPSSGQTIQSGGQTTVPVKPSSSIKTTMASSFSTSTTTNTAHLKCHTINAIGRPLVSLVGNSNITELETQMRSSLARRLNVNVTDVTATLTVGYINGSDRVYTVSFYRAGTGQIVGPTLTRLVTQEVCLSTIINTVTPIDTGKKGQIAVIAGAVSAAVLMAAFTPFAVFLYKRKCKRSKVESDDIQQSATKIT